MTLIYLNLAFFCAHKYSLVVFSFTMATMIRNLITHAEYDSIFQLLLDSSLTIPVTKYLK